MTELTLLETAVQLGEKGEACALVTVIRTKGSTPRKTGTKMIIFANGHIRGTIGGGCGEAEVIEQALLAIQKNSPLHYQVDLTSGLLYEDGGICGGIMDVFIEPIKRANRK